MQQRNVNGVQYYEAQIVMTSDYYPFGMLMEDTTNWKSDSSYLYGFQGQETDNEINGDGNSVVFSFRIHNSKIGRFMSIDPLDYRFPWNSPYSFAENKVLENIELEGAETYNSTKYLTRNSGYVLVLSVSNPAGRTQFIQSLSVGGRIRPIGTVVPSMSNIGLIKEERQLIGTGKGNHSLWRPINGGLGFQNNHRSASPLEYNAYRPVLWKSSDDGSTTSVDKQEPQRVNARIYQVSTATVEDDNVYKSMNQAGLEVQAIAKKDVPESPPIQASSQNVASIPHPDAPGETIDFVQRSSVSVTISVETQEITMDVYVQSEYAGSISDQVQKIPRGEPRYNGQCNRG